MKSVFSSRRGSALLIVLGMLSFMIVSAVSFSVYMRMSRAPSSYLRRNIATQHLVKAALARAIEDIDGKIGNDPYPGVGRNATEVRNWTALDLWRYSGYENAWVNRVFCPYANNQGDTSAQRTSTGSTIGSSQNSNVLSFEDTASILTLEALGYIPAPLVNQARYWSRRSETARWKRFNYDLGRWAYTAINVSDLLDVNTLRANTNRNSGAYGRLSLSMAAKNAGTTGQMFDTFVKNRGDTENQVPFVSMMDFNLAAGRNGALPAPFYDWITRGGNNGFYGSSQSNEVASLLFVTDSWYPSTNQFQKANAEENNYYLSKSDDQPFLRFNNTRGMLEFFKNGNPAGAGDSLMDIFAPQLRAGGVACLYDYLDRDSVPTSLALPCTEQTPMIIGICPILRNLQFTVKRTDTSTSQVGPPLVEKTESQYTIKMEPLSVNINASLLFPFKRLKDSRSPGSFKVQALVRVYFGADNMPLRLPSTDSPLHPASQTGTWSAGTRFENGIYTIVSPLQNVTLPNASNFDLGDEAEALVDLPLMTFTGNDATEYPFFHRVEEKVDGVVKRDQIDAFNFLPYAADGTQAAWSGTGFNKNFNNNAFIPNVAVWLRVVDDDGKTVDLAPATLQDDNLNWSLGLSASQAAVLGGVICGSGTPLFNFKTKNITFPTTDADWLALGKAILPGAQKPFQADMADDYGTIYCYDPRYNYAPEDWYATTDKGVDADKWLENQKTLLGADGRDSDIFMFVSNQEYLQSMGELAFLPRLQDLDANGAGGNVLEGLFFDAGRFNGTGITFADRIGFNVANGANRIFYWRTYRSYEHGGVSADPLYDLKSASGMCIFDDDGRGPRVNPYTDDVENIFMSAIDNTPYDYWAASTNVSLGSAYANTFSSNPSLALKHCFNDETPLAKINQQQLRDIAGIMRTSICSAPGGNWIQGYNALDWYGNGDPQCFFSENKNITETALNEVDRKFLYSYWRGCFGNRQQLFLVFVRAEPSVMGGAQQGGRAVALVWRDPAAPAGYADRISRWYEENQNQHLNDHLPPHRTRVLFYHQLD